MSGTPTRGFTGRGAPTDPAARGRVPPGQHLVPDFPVLSLGPTPHVRPENWTLDLRIGPRYAARWTWQEFNTLPQTRWTKDIHCVTTWSKLDTSWEGVLFDDLLRAAGLDAPPTPFLLAHSSDGYATNIPVADLAEGRAMVATRYGGEPLEPEHGGPARLLVPHLYFWKSAKWLKGLQFIRRDEAGFWELRGYHMRGDPWKEERYSDD